MSRIKDKARLLDLGNVQMEPRERSNAPRTAIGTLSQVIAMDERTEETRQSMQDQIDRLTRELEIAQGQAQSGATAAGERVEVLDPTRIRPSVYANRHDDAFRNEAFLDLKNDIAQTGRNVQPIKVRRSHGGESTAQPYEIVFGHRRHRACLELELPVVAIVCDMDDETMFAEMDRENRDREDLSAWEQGVMYRKALENGLFPSLRKLCEALGADSGNASKALALAELPPEVLSAFGSPLVLQFRWGPLIRDALQARPEQVLAACREMSLMNPVLPPKRVLNRLIGADVRTQASQDRLFQRAGKVAGAWKRDARGEIQVKIKPGMLSEADEAALQASLQKMLEQPSAD